MKAKSKILLTLLTVLTVLNVYSRRPEINGNNVTNTNPTPAADCAPAVDIEFLELNNVRCRIEGTGGSMWQNRADGIADYEIPKRQNPTDPKRTSIYAGALWMGGTDVNGQLKLAAVTFRNTGNDFWPGPLNTTTAEIDPATCAKYDKFFKITRAEVDKFLGWWNCKNDPGCDVATEYPDYSIPKSILDYPAHGDVSLGQDYNLAPFYDVDGDGYYDPYSGDYPYYDVTGDIDCRQVRDVRLFGDETLWWVFNDKGNTHSESGGPSIGMEIRAQAFAFATNDEVNNMTFYNYELINRSTFTLQDTYFGQWVDSDLGFSNDDYVGCDAERGLGYSYNGDNDDEDGNGVSGYGAQPPAIGVDFFEGPYADNDGIDNPLTQNVSQALAQNGIPYSGLGIGYGDSIVDNERYGMRKFTYYNIGGGVQGDPTTALDHYNYMRGIWRDGANMLWGGNAHPNSGASSLQCDLMFPGDSDPLFWSTQGQTPSPAIWTEQVANNTPGDRRFLQSAGPFTLQPGAVNDITVGVVWARATSGGPFASVEKLRLADDKAQALFDNCFKVLNGPDAPDLAVQELDRELILYISNKNVSNNYNEEYIEKDPFVVIPDTLDGVYISDIYKDTLKNYKFQGYQIYQVKNSSISVTDLDDPDVARLAFQCDLKDGISQLINFTYSEDLQANIPEEMVNGADEGIKHSFRVKRDLFATGDDRLINHKTYYYLAIAYGHNEFKKYDPLDPLALDGQTRPYIASRKKAGGAGIVSIAAIPHNPAPENGGTYANSEYGDQPEIRRIEGQGNGGNDLLFTTSTEGVVVANNFANYPVYAKGRGPIDIKVVDPLSVVGGEFKVQFQDTATSGDLSDAYWLLKAPDGKTIASDKSILIENEQLFTDYGISINIKQYDQPGDKRQLGNGAIGGEIIFEDSSKVWLEGITDVDGTNDWNWIRSGTDDFENAPENNYNDYTEGSGFQDPNQDFEGFVNGTWAPYRLVATATSSGSPVQHAPAQGRDNSLSVKLSKLAFVNSVDVVITSDKSKWSRCVVFETRNDNALTQGGARHMDLRQSASVDKNGNDDGSGTVGKGWFPGYAVNLETGERLNIAFGEDSWLAGENGRDMKWNPTSTLTAGVFDPNTGTQEIRWGGKHFIYVFRSDANLGMPAYDGCEAIYNKMITVTGSNVNPLRDVFRTCMWVGAPVLADGHKLFETDVRVSLRVEKSYEDYNTASNVNNDLPMYGFNLDGLATEFDNDIAIDSALAMINVVPNPYYAYSEYETSQLDNRVKITNLPEECTISIYNVNGTLMKKFNKADPMTSLDWDLKNTANIPVASGVYLIHIKVPDVGERVLKWFGVMKPVDLNTF